MNRQLLSRQTFILTFFAVLSFGLAACGNKGGGAPTSSLPTPTVVPTYRYIPPTDPPMSVNTPPATESAVATQSGAGAPTLDPDKVELGKNRYVALECGSCHGEKGEGTPKGSSLLGMKLTQDQFVDFLRSGGKLGNDHLYSTNRLSDAGGKNLYVYVLSLNANK